MGAGEEERARRHELHSGSEAAVRHERAMLRSVLDLTDVQVGEIMVHRRNLMTLDADLPPSEIVSQVLASAYTRLPLWRDTPDNIVGILHTKALFGRRGGQRHIAPGRRILAANPVIPEYTLLLATPAFRDGAEHFACSSTIRQLMARHAGGHPGRDRQRISTSLT
jgi:Mg2+/Co2+ transporter CorB